MGRSRSSSSDEKSSRRSKKSKKRSRNRSSSREESSGRRDKRGHRSRSRSRDRRRSRSKERRRSRSRDRRRSKSRDRRGRSRSYSPKVSKRYTRSRSSSSSSRSSRSTNKKKTRERKNVPANLEKENQASRNTDLSAQDMDRIAREAADIDQSNKFVSKAFVSSSGTNQGGKENTRGVKSETEFTFGTAGETQQVEKFMAQINEEGLCHPKLFEITKEKEEAYIKRMFQLRQKIAAERKSKQDSQ